MSKQRVKFSLSQKEFETFKNSVTIINLLFNEEVFVDSIKDVFESDKKLSKQNMKKIIGDPITMCLNKALKNVSLNEKKEEESKDQVIREKKVTYFTRKVESNDKIRDLFQRVEEHVHEITKPLRYDQRQATCYLDLRKLVNLYLQKFCKAEDSYMVDSYLAETFACLNNRATIEKGDKSMVSKMIKELME